MHGYIFENWLCEMADRLVVFGVAMQDSSGEMREPKVIAHDINEVYRLSNLDEDESEELIALLHGVCELI